MSKLLEEVSLERLTFTKPSGERIVALLSSPRHAPVLAAVVMCPGHGRTLRHLGTLSRLLNRHGYITLRFDFTHQTGDSDGDVYDTRVSSCVEDLHHVLGNLPRALSSLPRFLVSASMGARAAIRAVADGCDPTLGGLLLMLPAVNVAYTFRAAAGEDIVALALQKALPPERTTVTMGSHELSLRVLWDAIENGFTSLDSTRDELARIRCPVASIVAEEDDWVDRNEVAVAMGPLSSNRRLYVLEGSSHDLGKNPPMMRLLAETVLRSLEGMAGRTLEEVRHLEFAETVETAKAEKRFMDSALARPTATTRLQESA